MKRGAPATFSPPVEAQLLELVDGELDVLPCQAVALRQDVRQDGTESIKYLVHSAHRGLDRWVASNLVFLGEHAREEAAAVLSGYRRAREVAHG